jgi:hypothetical protein
LNNEAERLREQIAEAKRRIAYMTYMLSVAEMLLTALQNRLKQIESGKD